MQPARFIESPYTYLTLGGELANWSIIALPLGLEPTGYPMIGRQIYWFLEAHRMTGTIAGA